MGPGVGPEGWLRRFAHPLGVAVCRGHAQYSAFVPDTLFLLQAPQKWQLGFSGLFVSFGSRICPDCACTQLFLVPYSFFVFCWSRRGVSVCKHCSTAAKGPGSQPVSLSHFSYRHRHILSCIDFSLLRLGLCPPEIHFRSRQPSPRGLSPPSLPATTLRDKSVTGVPPSLLVPHRCWTALLSPVPPPLPAPQTLEPPGT